MTEPVRDRLRRLEAGFFRADNLWPFEIALLACVVLFYAVCLLRGIWLVDADGTPIAVDFVATWAAGHLALAGDAVAAYDLPTITAEEVKAVAGFNGQYPWSYPPTYFLLIAPLAMLSYLAAAALWIPGTLIAYLATIRAIVPRRATIPFAVASPFVLWNGFVGQNGCLIAALIGGTLVNLDRRPILAGFLLGLLTWKPQFGLLFPVVLILTGRWRVFAAAALTALLMFGASWLLFGGEAWQAFLAALQQQSSFYLDRGVVPWWKLQSVFALVRSAGGDTTLAWILHGAVAGAAAIFVCWLWTRPVRTALKAAALSTAALLVTPYLFLYDLPIVSVPVAFLVSAGMAGGFFTGERSFLALLAVAMLASSTVPVGIPLLAIIMLLIALHVSHEQRKVAQS